MNKKTYIIISVIVIFLLAFGILSSVFQENDYSNNIGNNNLAKIARSGASNKVLPACLAIS